MTNPRAQAPITVAIIGGGLSGAAVAYHLAGLTDADIVVVEPRAELGRGMAYATPDPDHCLNVPDHKMTLRSDRPEDFRAWLHRADAPSLPASSARLSGEIYAPPRGVRCLCRSPASTSAACGTLAACAGAGDLGKPTGPLSPGAVGWPHCFYWGILNGRR